MNPVAREAAFDGLSIPANLVVLIHGYNTPAGKARDHYQRFEDWMLDSSCSRMSGVVGRVLWPGYEDRSPVPSVHFALSAMRAKRCSEVLARFLAQKFSAPGVTPHVVFVAHSLGSLVATETAKQLLSTQQSKIRVTLLLMAAAIPVSGKYGDLRSASATAVLYSPDDEILSTVYRAGQWLTDRQWSEAVGLRGLPDEGVWHQRHWMPGYKHGDYWGSSLAATLTCEFHGRPHARPPTERMTPEMPMPAERSLEEYGARRPERGER